MPIYNMRNTETQEVTEVWLKMAEREQYLLDNPHMKQEITQVNMACPIRMGVTKPHSALTDKIKSIKKAHLGSNIVV